MALKLYGNAASPFVRKVMVILHETGQCDEVELVVASGSTLDPGTIPVRGNPLAKIPVLETAAGLMLFDSRVICRFFADRADAAIYPAGDALWPTLRAEALADGIMDAALALVYEARLRPPDMRSAAIMEGQTRRILRALADLDTQRDDSAIGGIATAVALEYLDFRLPSIDWRHDAPALAGWLAAYAERPAMRATRPDRRWPGE